MPDLFGLAAIVTKFVLYLGLITAAGTVMATLMFRLERTRGLAAIFAVLGLFATILGFSLRGANLTGDLSGMTDPMMLSRSSRLLDWHRAVKSSGSLQTNREPQIWRPDDVCDPA